MVPIKTIMTINVVTIQQGALIYEALDMLTKNEISGVPVVDEKRKVVGMLSEKDVLKLLLDQGLDVKATVDDYMTREVISFSEDSSAIDICKFFIRSHIRRVPIVRDEKLVGVVSRRDIVKLILEAKSKMSPSFRYV